MISQERCFAQPQACGEVWKDIGRKNCTKDFAQTCSCSCESCEKTIHKGRHLIFKLRKINGQVNTKSYAVLPLPPKVASKGSSAGAESFLEVAKGVSQKLKPGKHNRFCRWLPGAAKSSWSCQDSKFERCFPSPLRIYAAGHPPRKRYDPRLCDTATQTGARWDGKRKERQFHIGSW